MISRQCRTTPCWWLVAPEKRLRSWAEVTPSRVELPAAANESASQDISGRAVFTASGKVITFPGFLKAYKRSNDNEDDEQTKVLPPVAEGQALPASALEATEHNTKPPARFTEVSLVKTLEERGIGRPSTYASIISTIQDRGYARIESKRFYAEKMGEIVNDRLLENFDDSRQIYSMFDSKNSVYDWYAQKRLALIKSKLEDNESALSFLNKSFNELENPTVKNYYDLANFYKDFEKYEESIKYYTKALNIISNDHLLYPKILHRRGMSYERLKLWEKSEDDLIQSLSLVPEEPYVLNYLAYSWLERNINLEKSMEMLEVAFNKKREDPYIIDSLGWGMYLTGRYEEAEKLLQKAVKLMPLDPIVNDHYADILWKLNKNLQANYFWNYVLNLETTENEMKDKIKEKLILGIQNHS